MISQSGRENTCSRNVEDSEEAKLHWLISQMAHCALEFAEQFVPLVKLGLFLSIMDFAFNIILEKKMINAF